MTGWARLAAAAPLPALLLSFGGVLLFGQVLAPSPGPSAPVVTITPTASGYAFGPLTRDATFGPPEIAGRLRPAVAALPDGHLQVCVRVGPPATVQSWFTNADQSTWCLVVDDGATVELAVDGGG